MMASDDLIELKRRMQAVKVKNFYGSIVRDALAAIELLQDETIMLREKNCSRLSDLYDVAGQSLDAGHMSTENLARLRAAWEKA